MRLAVLDVVELLGDDDGAPRPGASGSDGESRAAGESRPDA